MSTISQTEVTLLLAVIGLLFLHAIDTPSRPSVSALPLHAGGVCHPLKTQKALIADCRVAVCAQNAVARLQLLAGMPACIPA